MATGWQPHLLKVFFSNRYTYASILQKTHPKDNGHFVASASTIQKPLREQLRAEGRSASDVAAAALVGRLLAERAAAVDVGVVRFERGRRRYAGKVRALVEALREAGVTVK